MDHRDEPDLKREFTSGSIGGVRGADKEARKMSGNCTTTITVNCGNGGGGTTGAGSSNLLINSRGQINQRAYASGTPTGAANQYTVDRWRVVTSGQNLSWVESEGTKTFTAPAGGVEQVIEGANIITGTHVISFTGTATCEIDGVPKVSGDTVVLTGGSNATVRFLGGTFSLPQLEPGTTPTSFEGRPIGQELILCQRYFYAKEFAPGPPTELGQCTSATGGTVLIQFPTIMRALPVGTHRGGDLRVSGAGGSGIVATPGNIFETLLNSQIVFTVAGGLVAGNVTTMRGDSGPVFIDYDAEL